MLTTTSKNGPPRTLTFKTGHGEVRQSLQSKISPVPSKILKAWSIKF
uniref:Uncharacterized protein n=1 Tax=Anguilla anguilla TaxID=7936 RepID=A0A0E9VV31_ANGAN